MKKAIYCIIIMSFIAAAAGCSKESTSKTEFVPQTAVSQTEEPQSADETQEFDSSTAAKITITSESINDSGQLLTRTSSATASPKGKNISPQLTWEAVEGAKCYSVYMYDTSAGNWLHWMQNDISVTSLEENGGKRHYIGPYPPSGGAHQYEITVYALKNTPDKYEGKMDTTADRNIIENALDISGEKHGNILAMGSLTGKTANGVTVE